MGQDIRSQLGISIEVLKETMNQLEQMKQEASEQEQSDKVAETLALVHLLFTGSLRGNEVLLLDLHGLRTHINKGKTNKNHPHVVAPLLGRFKGEDGERYHMLLIASVTHSGLNTRKYLEQLIELRTRQGYFKGPAFCKNNGSPADLSDCEPYLYDALLRVQTRCENVIGEEVEVTEVYGFSRSFRRGSTTRAKEAGISESLVDEINRWSKVERAQGKRPALPLRDHYTEVVQLLERRIRYSAAL